MLVTYRYPVQPLLGAVQILVTADLPPNQSRLALNRQQRLIDRVNRIGQHSNEICKETNSLLMPSFLSGCNRKPTCCRIGQPVHTDIQTGGTSFGAFEH